jgi:hypothetical protein
MNDVAACVQGEAARWSMVVMADQGQSRYDSSFLSFRFMSLFNPGAIPRFPLQIHVSFFLFLTNSATSPHPLRLVGGEDEGSDGDLGLVPVGNEGSRA